MIPETLRDGTTSIGERRLFNRFKRELSDDYYVLHSLGLTEHKNKIWAEADFVIVSAQGIYVVEVKSGGISCKEGIWIFTDHNGFSTRKPEGPFEQAKTAMYSIKQEIEKNENYKGLMFGYGVIMPDEDFKSDGPEIEIGVLLDRNGWDSNLSKYLQKIEGFWSGQYKSKHSRAIRAIDKVNREHITKILRPDVITAYTLASRLNNIDRQVVELTNEQMRIVRGMENNTRTIIQGGAGTGKSILAFDRAINLAGKGKKVILLCFNRMLAENFNENLPADLVDSGLIRADSIHRYFYSIIESSGKLVELKEVKESSHDLFSKIYPALYMDCMMGGKSELYDTVIVDEAQDLLTHDYLDAIDLTLKDGLSHGSWHLFMDRKQNIYGANSEGPEQRLKQIGYAEFNLSNNCRNTLKVAVQSWIVSGIQVPLTGAAEGGSSKIIYYTNNNDFIAKLELELKEILKNGLNTGDFIILSPRTFENSAIKDMKTLASYKIRNLAVDHEYNKTVIDFCTMYSFKGLERKAVIAIDIAHIADDSNSILYYAGLSRARGYLTVFINDTEKDDLLQNVNKFGKWLAENKI